MYGVKCPKCGLMQLPKEQCESCGRKLEGHKGLAFERPSPEAISAPSYWPQSEVTVQVRPKTDLIETRSLSFHGAGWPLFGIHVLNAFLTIITLGFYSFWGKTKVRRFLWGGTEMEGDRFVYHGTGKELLIGFFKAMLVFTLPVTLLNILPLFLEPKKTASVICMLLTYDLLMVFIPLAMVGARRYRLSRTSWRGIHFSFRGKTWEFVKIFLGGGILTLLTLGFYYPFFTTNRHEFMVAHAYFGNHRFEFDGRGRDLLKPFLLAVLMTLPTLGLCWFWFLAGKQRYFWGHTHLDAIHFRSTVTGRRFLALHATNLLLLILTLGLAWSWVMVRKIRFTFAYLTLDGLVDPAMIRQDAQDATAIGDILAGFMDAGLDLGS